MPVNLLSFSPVSWPYSKHYVLWFLENESISYQHIPSLRWESPKPLRWEEPLKCWILQTRVLRGSRCHMRKLLVCFNSCVRSCWKTLTMIKVDDPYLPLLLFIQAKAGRLTSGQLYRTDNLVTDHLAGKLYTLHPTAVSVSPQIKWLVLLW